MQVSTSRTYTFNIAANRNLVANFTQQFAVTTSSNPLLGGTTSGGGTYADGSTATVVATPNQGYIFLNWTEGSTVVSSIPSYTFTVSGNRTLVANFQITSFTITTINNPPGGGTTSGGGSYNYGQNATVVATPTAGWSFVNWTENNLQVSAEKSYTFSVNAERTLTANFSLVPVLTIIAPNGGESWQSGVQKSIQWNTVNVTNVKLEFSIDSGSSWMLIAENLPASTGLYDWTVPDTPSDQCLVKVTDVSNPSITDASNGVFSILSRLILLSPNGGEVWAANTIKNISWLGSGIATLIIDYSTNAGSEWINITSTDASAGNYAWQVPATYSNQVLVRIASSDNVFSDISNGVFEIYSSNITLLPGEIAIVGYNFSNSVPNEFAFVVLKEEGIPANTVITFTDRGVFRGDNSLNPRRPAGSFVDKGPGEGDLVYIAPTFMPAGSVVSWRIDQAHPDFLWDEQFDPSGIGDQIIVFQYDEGVDTSFIYAMNNELVGPEKWQVDLNVSVPDNAPFRSNLPPGLTDSVNAMAFDVEIDNRVYVGGDRPTVGELLSAIVNESNWVGDDYVGQIMPVINLITSVDEVVSDEIPTGFELFQNFPNPFNPTSIIRYSVPEENFVLLKVYDILGNEIRTLVNETKKPGIYQVVFDAGNIESGVYFYRLQSADFTATKKLVLVK